MKKLFISGIQLLMSALLVTGSASAQRNMAKASVASSQPFEPGINVTANETAKAGTDLKDIHYKAINNFNKRYKDARDVRWSNSDKTIMASYEENGAQNRVIYLRNGKWLHTLISYDQTRLAEPVRQIVNDNFRGYDITSVTEVHERDKIIHFVNIEDKKRIKQVAVYNDNFHVYKSFRKTH